MHTMSTELPTMADEVGKEHLTVKWTTAALVVGHSLLAAGVLLMILIFIFTYLRRGKHNHHPKAFVPLPTPPVCRRQLSVHTVYPPTPPITREQLSIYTICRPTPPDSPLISVGTLGKSSLSSPSFRSSPRFHRSLFSDRLNPRLHRVLLPGTPPLLPHSGSAPPIASLPGSPQPKAPQRSNSLPGCSADP
ncbi:hypothetical protein GWK47_040818 [Chionoecetes opilio]|uniref:Uncharacterized protein n=1 Tax=Chionoecetes opilio TaxID=41210 RepID=A0A8J4YAC7_CHIOP|nr:hypothetical protein GWK47_040818 [Chionoecetes opilio]